MKSMHIPPSDGDLVQKVDRRRVGPWALAKSRFASTFRGRGARLRAMWAAPTPADRNVRWLYASTAMAGIEMAGIMAYLPVYLARLGGSTAQVSLLTSAPAIVSIFVLIPGGLLTERFPDTVRLRVRAVLLYRLLFVVLILAPSFIESSLLVSVAIVLWALRAIGLAVSMPAWMTAVSDAIPPHRRARVNGVRWALLSLVSALLSALFGWMLDRIRFPLNYQILFFLSLLGGLLELYFFSRLKVSPLEVKPRAPSALGSLVAQLRTSVRSYVSSIAECRDFTRYLLATLAFRATLNMPAALFSLYWVNELKASDSWIGLRGTAGYGALVVGYIAWGRLAHRIKHRRVLTVSALLLALYPIATGLIRSASWLPAVAVIWGLAASGVDIGLFDLMLEAVPKDRMPRMSSILNLVGSAAAFLGPLMGAALSQATSLGTALLVVGALQLLSIVTFRMLPSDV